MAQTSYLIFIQCSLGLEELLLDEVRAWGRGARTLVGGVEMRVDQRGLWEVCLRSRLAEGVRLRFKRFKARRFDALQAELKKLPFRAYLPAETSVQVRVTCRASKLWHSDAVAERVASVLTEHVGYQLHEDDTAPSSSFVHTVFVRLEEDEVQVSLDAGGPRMHRRGERTRVEKASLRETLAAALVHLARQRLAPLERARSAPELPVVWDPFCGAGTLPLEWCGVHAGRAPGLRRQCAFEHFTGFDSEAFSRLRAELQTEERALGSALLVVASDLSTHAVQSTRDNLAQAGWSNQAQVLHGDVAQVAAHVPQGAVVLTNPPYGRRLAEAKAIQTLLGVLEARPDLRPAIALVGGAAQSCVPSERPALARFKNGGLAVSARLLRD